MASLNRTLLVEDNPNDAKLTLEALSRHNLANAVTWVHDGAEALDYCSAVNSMPAGTATIRW